MSLRLYDTLTREKRPFVPVTPGKAGMYVCGMTVQDKPHVGHIRSSLVGRHARRYLEHLGYEVTYVYNFTDVDDKIIEPRERGGPGVQGRRRAQHRRLPAATPTCTTSSARPSTRKRDRAHPARCSR